FVADARADDTNGVGVFLVDFVEETAMLERVEIHINYRRPDPDRLFGNNFLFAVGNHDVADFHFGGNEAEQGSAFAQSLDIGHGTAWGLIREMFLFGRDVLLFEQDLVGATHGDHRFAHAIFHSFDNRGHADQAGDAEDNAQHGQQ